MLTETNGTGASIVGCLLLSSSSVRTVSMSAALLVTHWSLVSGLYHQNWGQLSKMFRYKFKQRGGRKKGEKCRKKMKKSWEGGRKRRVARRGGNNEGLRPSQAHGSGGTSVRPASGQQLHAAQRVGAESRSQNSEPRYRSGGGSPGWHLQTVFFFPLSLRLCADSHVGGLIKPHVPPDGSLARRRRPAGGAAASLMSPPTRWGSGPGEDWG